MGRFLERRAIERAGLHCREQFARAGAIQTGTRELRELSLAVNTADGLVLLVACSHPGIDKIVEAAAAINPKIHLIAGGFHLVVRPRLNCPRRLADAR